MARSKSNESRKQEITRLLNAIWDDDSYGVYVSLVGGRHEYLTGEGTYEEKRDRANNSRDQLIRNFSEDSVLLIQVVNHIAELSGDIEEWKLNTYNLFLERLAENKPDAAYMLLSRAIKSSGPLIRFVGHFLTGFKKGGSGQGYDESLRFIIDHKVHDALPNVAYSLKDSSWSEEEIDIAKDLVYKSGRFDFAADESWPNYLYALTISLAANIQEEKPIIKELFIELLNRYDKHSVTYLGAIDMAGHRGYINAEKFDEDIKTTLMNKLILVERGMAIHRQVQHAGTG